MANNRYAQLYVPEWMTQLACLKEIELAGQRPYDSCCVAGPSNLLGFNLLAANNPEEFFDSESMPSKFNYDLTGLATVLEIKVEDGNVYRMLIDGHSDRMIPVYTPD